MEIANIPPSRIVVFGQSLGTAVSLAVSEHFALQTPPVVFAGTILVAAFTDEPTLATTYKVAGVIPILSPIARVPMLFGYFNRWIADKWMSKDRIARYVRANEANGEKYRLTLIHAEDDWDIPWSHTPALFWHAISSTLPLGTGYGDLEKKKAASKVDLGAAGTVVEWQTENGIIREEILKTGLHDEIMGYYVVTMAVMRLIGAGA